MKFARLASADQPQAHPPSAGRRHDENKRRMQFRLTTLAGSGEVLATAPPKNIDIGPPFS